MEELSIIETVSTLGVGAVFGLVVFFVYRIDRKATDKRIHDVHKSHSDKLEILLSKDQETREENTKVMAELCVLLKSMNGRGRRTR